MPGCGITPDALPAGANQPASLAQRDFAPKRHESSQYTWYRTVPTPRRTSRFADIKRVTFFEKARPETSPAAAPPVVPAPAALEAKFQKASELQQVEILPEPAPEATAPVVVIPESPSPFATLPTCGPVQSEIRLTQNQKIEKDDKIPDPVDDPRKLKKISEIQPFANYEPDPEVRAKDPCKNLCPRPDGAPCKMVDGKPPLCPDEVILSKEDYVPRAFGESVFGWEASNVSYNPLYFEDFALERYGHTYPCWVQPFASVGKFGVQLVGLPYQMSIDPVCKRIYPLGYYRPGECAPKLHYQIPWNTRAAAAQAAVTTGMFFLIP